MSSVIRAAADPAALLRPSAVSVVGASPRSFFAASLVDNLLGGDHPFAGEVALVNPGRAELDGHPCVPSLADVAHPGLVYLVVPPERCIPAVEQAAEGSIEGVVAITSGFPAEGPASQEALAEWCAVRGIPLLGPNCLGLFDLRRSFFGYAGPLVHVRPGPVALVMQSGGMLSGVVAALDGRGIGVGIGVSFGNAASVGYGDLVRLALDDSGTEVVLLYAESIGDVRRLRAAGEHAARVGKRIVLVQGGSSDAGAVAARSHTGQLATPSRVVAGIADQVGIVRCRGLEEAVWSVEALLHAPRVPASGAGIAVITSSGGGAVAIADAAADVGVRLAAPGGALRARIAAAAGVASGEVANPLDVGADVMNAPERLEAVVSAVAAEHAVVVHMAGVGLPRPELPRHEDAARRVVAAGSGASIVLGAVVDGVVPDPADWPGVVFGASARETLVKAHALSVPPGAVVAADSEPGSGAPSDLAGSRSGARPRLLTGVEATSRLAGLAVSWPEQVDVASGPEPVRAWTGPVVLKAEGLAHRVAAGGLVASVGASGLDAAWTHLRTRFPDARLTAVRQVAHGAEFIVGVIRTEDHGALLSFGPGGTGIGAGVRLRSLPATGDQLADLVRAVLDDVGGGVDAGGAEADGERIAALLALVASVARLAGEPGIRSIDLNPVAFDADGTLWALDAKLETEEE